MRTVAVVALLAALCASAAASRQLTQLTGGEATQDVVTEFATKAAISIQSAGFDQNTINLAAKRVSEATAAAAKQAGEKGAEKEEIVAAARAAADATMAKALEHVAQLQQEANPNGTTTVTPEVQSVISQVSQAASEEVIKKGGSMDEANQSAQGAALTVVKAVNEELARNPGKPSEELVAVAQKAAALWGSFVPKVEDWLSKVEKPAAGAAAPAHESGAAPEPEAPPMESVGPPAPILPSWSAGVSRLAEKKDGAPVEAAKAAHTNGAGSAAAGALGLAVAGALALVL